MATGQNVKVRQEVGCVDKMKIMHFFIVIPIKIKKSSK